MCLDNLLRGSKSEELVPKTTAGVGCKGSKIDAPTPGVIGAIDAPTRGEMGAMRDVDNGCNERDWG